MHRIPDDGTARRRQMARTAAALFAAAALITALGVALPHQPQVDEDGLLGVAAWGALIAVALVAGGQRLPGWSLHVATACGTVLVSLALLFNGERHGARRAATRPTTCGSRCTPPTISGAWRRRRTSR